MLALEFFRQFVCRCFGVDVVDGEVTAFCCEFASYFGAQTSAMMLSRISMSCLDTFALRLLPLKS